MAIQVGKFVFAGESDAKPCTLGLDTVKDLPLGVECYVGAKTHGRKLEGVIPSHTVIKEPGSGRQLVRGMAIPAGSGKIGVRLPASSMGTDTWYLTAEEAEVVIFAIP